MRAGKEREGWMKVKEGEMKKEGRDAEDSRGSLSQFSLVYIISFISHPFSA